MAKRFTDTDKWKKQFIRGLQAPYKLLWLYICDDCNHAGIWEIDIEVAAIRIGEKINLEEAERVFKDKIIVLPGKWYIPSFIDFQYGNLNPVNKAHSSVINILTKFNLLDIKPLTSPLQGAKDKEMVKDKVKDKDKEKGHLFINSEFFDFNKFEKQFENSDYANADLKIYYESVKNWSASTGAKKIDWIATARNFIIGDLKSNKLKLKNGTTKTGNDLEADVKELLRQRYGN